MTVYTAIIQREGDESFEIFEIFNTKQKALNCIYQWLKNYMWQEYFTVPISSDPETAIKDWFNHEIAFEYFNWKIQENELDTTQ